MHTTFFPGTRDGVASAEWGTMRVRFVLRPTPELLDQYRWEETLTRARGGDLTAQEVAAFVGEFALRDSGLSIAELNGLLVDSAQQGLEFSRLRIYEQLQACGRASLVDRWLFHSANAGSPAAKLWWASALLQSHDPEFAPKAGQLIRDSAQSDDPFYQLLAAGRLATDPEDVVRNPALALKVAEALDAKRTNPHQSDPDYTELLAASQAANGRYDDAIRTEQRAMAQARQMHWKLDAMAARLATYEAHRPWRGLLCDCDFGGLP